MASYRNKRRKIQDELQAFYSSNDDITYSPLKESNNEQNILLKNVYAPEQQLSDSSVSDSGGHNITINYRETQLQPSLDLELICVNNESTVEINCNSPELIKKKLGKWTTDFNVPQNSVNALLQILRNNCNLEFLPKDCRTLFQSGSSKVANLRKIGSGVYYHFGLAAGISRFSSIISSDDKIKIVLGVDGLPISKSSSSQFWPILAYIHPYKNYVFPVGIYHGNEKPQDSNIYLKDWVSEVLDLTTSGIIVNKLKKYISIEVICCDAPAKSFLMRVKKSFGIFIVFKM
ncbi:unnamed protein product [Macrosiphum euphorbiae]|uniref:Uncharacterized protein n=1 Tax=Macrosiphum euphorbiae TaxID=13131 RepID=A0AAV0XQ50_9HEMI|nr:unnamed protein product [Macrosiphum euphorbiae]